jgi:hypothetical protein
VDRDDELDELQVALAAAPPSELASLLDRVVRGMGAPGTDAVELVFGRWGDVVGGVLATRTRPVSLEHATLVLEADDPAVVSPARRAAWARSRHRRGGPCRPSRAPSATPLSRAEMAGASGPAR